MSPPNLIYIPGNRPLIAHPNSKQVSRGSINSGLASRYVESNFEYREYLDYLENNDLDSLLLEAKPNTEIWDRIALPEEDIAYLKENYWTDQEFEDYPVLGLNWDQILVYLKWRTSQVQLTLDQKEFPNFYFSSYYLPTNIQAYATIKYAQAEKVFPKNWKPITKGRQPAPPQKNSRIKSRLESQGIVSVYFTDLFLLFKTRKENAYFEIVANFSTDHIGKEYRAIIQESLKERVYISIKVNQRHKKSIDATTAYGNPALAVFRKHANVSKESLPLETKSIKKYIYRNINLENHLITGKIYTKPLAKIHTLKYNKKGSILLEKRRQKDRYHQTINKYSYDKLNRKTKDLLIKKTPKGKEVKEKNYFYTLFQTKIVDEFEKKTLITTRDSLQREIKKIRYTETDTAYIIYSYTYDPELKKETRNVYENVNYYKRMREDGKWVSPKKRKYPVHQVISQNTINLDSFALAGSLPERLSWGEGEESNVLFFKPKEPVPQRDIMKLYFDKRGNIIKQYSIREKYNRADIVEYKREFF